MKKIFFFLLITSITAMLACKGEQGDPGPAGVVGKDGINGTNGQDGKDGKDGNANIRSSLDTVQATDWVQITSYQYIATIDVPIITQDIFDNGLVMVYSRNLGDSSYWLAWPLTISYGTGLNNFFYRINPGSITLYSQNYNFQPFVSGLEVRVVAASSEGLVHQPDLDWTKYDKVKEAFHLED